MQPTKIIGSVQIRNEDIYIERVISNILDFCDSILVADHQSTDRTLEICKRLAERHSKVSVQSIQSPREAAAALEPYFGTNSWIFGVDGDEVYDPQGLMIMRERLLSEEFSKDWCIFGNVLNIVSLDMKNKTAKGYLAPPSRSMTKLYNFSIIERWDNCPERLLGDEIRFKVGFSLELRRYLHRELDWEESYFRCLHMPFMKRSSRQKIRLSRSRLNPDEINTINLEKGTFTRFLRWVQLQIMLAIGVDWKNQKYRRGSMVKKDITPFFSR